MTESVFEFLQSISSKFDSELLVYIEQSASKNPRFEIVESSPISIKILISSQLTTDIALKFPVQFFIKLETYVYGSFKYYQIYLSSKVDDSRENRDLLAQEANKLFQELKSQKKLLQFKVN